VKLWIEYAMFDQRSPSTRARASRSGS